MELEGQRDFKLVAEMTGSCCRSLPPPLSLSLSEVRLYTLVCSFKLYFHRKSALLEGGQITTGRKAKKGGCGVKRVTTQYVPFVH